MQKRCKRFTMSFTAPTIPSQWNRSQGSRYVGRRGSGKPTVASCRPTGGLTRPTLRRIKLNKSLLVVKVVVLSFCLTSRSVNVAAFAVSGYRCFPDCN